MAYYCTVACYKPSFQKEYIVINILVTLKRYMRSWLAKFYRWGLLLRYYYPDIWGQHITGKASKHKSYIEQLHEGKKQYKNGKWAIVVFFAPKGDLHITFTRLITALQAQKVNILLVCNHALNEAQETYFGTNCAKIMIRKNQGFDIGAYKDAYQYLVEQPGFNITRLGFLNDSVFYIERGLDAFVKGLFQGKEDVISAFENWSQHYHFQSFALTISGELVYHDAVKGFWQNYCPVSNRVYCIEYGEKGFAHAIALAMRNSHVLYTLSALRHALQQAYKTGELADMFYSTTIFRFIEYDAMKRHEKLLQHPDVKDKIISHHMIDNYIASINNDSPIHSGLWGYVSYLECPIIKKDIVYRTVYTFCDAMSFLEPHISDEDTEIIATHFRAKGIGGQLKGRDRRLYQVGIK